MSKLIIILMSLCTWYLLVPWADSGSTDEISPIGGERFRREAVPATQMKRTAQGKKFDRNKKMIKGNIF